ncbi:hypothetical protein BD413DRAFT_196267 [Trametes elegans]|nr:hypothetical protein BD413DRAFT_196267 [Trametes elegans]
MPPRIRADTGGKCLSRIPDAITHVGKDHRSHCQNNGPCASFHCAGRRALLAILPLTEDALVADKPARRVRWLVAVSVSPAELALPSVIVFNAAGPSNTLTVRAGSSSWSRRLSFPAPGLASVSLVRPRYVRDSVSRRVRLLSANLRFGTRPGQARADEPNPHTTSSEPFVLPSQRYLNAPDQEGAGPGTRSGPCGRFRPTTTIAQAQRCFRLGTEQLLLLPGAPTSAHRGVGVAPGNARPAGGGGIPGSRSHLEPSWFLTLRCAASGRPTQARSLGTGEKNRCPSALFGRDTSAQARRGHVRASRTERWNRPLRFLAAERGPSSRDRRCSELTPVPAHSPREHARSYSPLRAIGRVEASLHELRNSGQILAPAPR